MPLQIPEIDGRGYQELLDEAIARIRVHNPEWTNYNPSDPGITLLQLFAFLAESVRYRSALIPERARIKFLQLLDIPLEPAHAAAGIVAFEYQSGPLSPILVETDLELLAGQVPFRTTHALSVVPAEGRAFVKAPLTADREAQIRARYELIYEGFGSAGDQLLLYETRPVDWAAQTVDLSSGTVDQTLWLALMARTPDAVGAVRRSLAGAVLTVGIVPETSGDGRVLAPGGPAAGLARELRFELPRVEPLPQDADARLARYTLIPSDASADVLAEPGLVQLTLPGDVGQLGLWEDLEPDEDGTGDFPPAVEGDDAERIVTWVRIRPAATAGALGQASVTLRWAGVNATLIQHRARVPHELVGRGSGAPDQAYALVNTPVLTDSVALTVDGTAWTLVDDLLAAAPEVPSSSAPGVGYGDQATLPATAYTVDRESGEIRFGDGSHGARPAAGALIEATYDYGGGRAGDVGVDAVTTGPALPAGLKVTNPLPTWGGDEALSVDEAERQIARVVRHRDRLVTAEDVQEIAEVTPGVDMGRVEVLALLNPQLPDARLPGVLTVMVIPQFDPVHPDAPEPDGLFLDLVCAHLEPRRLLTTELHVRGPVYVDVWASIGVDVEPGRDIAPVLEAVKRRIRTFLSPLPHEGRPEGGWPVATSVERLELWAQAANVDGVAKVFDTQLTDSSGTARDRVPMSGLQLPRLAAIAVSQGDPRPLDEIRGDAGSPPPGSAKTLPVPVDPVEC
ncbi:hypothetical protein OM076_38740 [Solirubrobacter ginsenosidimutans]|uniref:Baseplate assembly protein n=1 Tax=Solirubrobacter ginsenosidimutans TaxID=490573 RepID=A0A9X3N3Z7_9ACTN|nr:hypothetical protein [Solirubrobacter ginsenosidimutans]MDA0166267.1 hypothetical protein [Solirubrobacter ginsenosidimutans]